MSKSEYFQLTPAETYTKVQGYIHNRDVMSANFRALFVLNFNQWANHKKTAEQLWPLSFDYEDQLSEEEMYARNKLVIEDYYKRHPEQKKPN